MWRKVQILENRLVVCGNVRCNGEIVGVKKVFLIGNVYKSLIDMVVRCAFHASFPLKRLEVSDYDV